MFNSIPSNDSHITFPLVDRILSQHKDTLECFGINHLNHNSSDDELIDLRKYRSLKYLRLSRWSFQRTNKLVFRPETGRKLLAPCLEEFTWDFSLDDPRYVLNWTDFTKREARWIREFALFAVETKSKLSVISIEFPYYSNSKEHHAIYPWYLMEKVKEKVAQYGIELRYDDDGLTKEMWLNMLSDEEDISEGDEGSSDDDISEDNEDMSDDDDDVDEDLGTSDSG